MNNLSNKLISKNFIENTVNMFSKSKITVTDTNYHRYLQAFVHSSMMIDYSWSDPEDQMCCFMIDKTLISDNERLEWFGDSILSSITKEYIYDHFPKEKEGFMSKLHAKLVEKKHLHVLADALGFREYILFDCQQEKIGARKKTINLMENVFEAFIGALYKSEGYLTTKSFVDNLFKQNVNFEELVLVDDNYKTNLNTRFHSLKISHPKYVLVDKTPGFNAIFVSATVVNIYELVDPSVQTAFKRQHAIITRNIKNEYPGYTFDPQVYYLSLGKGPNKKASEQDSGRVCLEILNKLHI